MSSSAANPHAPWRLWILVVTFTLQLVFLSISIVVLGLAVGAYNSLRRDPRYTDELPALSTAIIAIDFSLIALMLLLTLSEVVQCARRRLTPAHFLSSNVTKCIVTIVSLGISISEGLSGTGSIVLNILVLLLFLVPVVYGSITFHKVRRYGKAGSYGGTRLADQAPYEGGAKLAFGVESYAQPQHGQTYRPS